MTNEEIANQLHITVEQVQTWRDANEKLAAKVDACANSPEFKAWLASLDDKCKHCKVNDGRFSDDELTRQLSLHACEFRCPKILVQSYYEEKGGDLSNGIWSND